MLDPSLSLSHWGMFALSFEEAEAVARVVIAGDAALWECDDSGWLEPDTITKAYAETSHKIEE